MEESNQSGELEICGGHGNTQEEYAHEKKKKKKKKKKK